MLWEFGLIDGNSIWIKSNEITSYEPIPDGCVVHLMGGHKFTSANRYDRAIKRQSASGNYEALPSIQMIQDGTQYKAAKLAKDPKQKKSRWSSSKYCRQTPLAKDGPT